MRSHIVVVGPPMSEFDPGLGQRREQRLVQQFVSETAIEGKRCSGTTYRMTG